MVRSEAGKQTRLRPGALPAVVSASGQHAWICKKALELQGRTSFKDHELCAYFLKTVGDDVLCFEKRKDFCIWHDGRWQETDGAIIADLLMTRSHELFQDILS